MAEYSGKFRLYKLGDFKKLPAMRWSIKPIVPRYGITLIFGEAKIGKKTFLGLSMACAIATGTAWCGFATTKGKVLYIGCEGFLGLLRRQAAWEKMHGVEAGDDLQLLRVPINFHEDAEVTQALTALKAQGFEPDFIVIDTLARSMSGGKENVTEDMTKVFEQMDHFRAELLRQQIQEFWSDAGMIIIHHADKKGLDYRGSSIIKGFVDAMIMVTTDGLEITLSSKGYKDAADFETFTVRCESISVDTEEGPEGVLAVKERVVSSLQTGKPPTKEEQDLSRMESALVCIGNKATYTQWFEEVHKWTTTKGKDGKAREGWSDSTFQRKLRKLKEQGRVTGGENQGDCYSMLFTERAQRARKGVQPDKPGGASEERAASQKTTVNNHSHSHLLKRDDCDDCGFGTARAQSNDSHQETDCGSPESGNCPDPAVVMTDLEKEIWQSMAKSKPH
jgi:hypothetical protein